jgi:hypothetical protein
MSRITRATIYADAIRAAKALRLPVEAVWAQRSATGWQVCREAGPHGAAAPIGECLTAGEAVALLKGLAAGGSLAAPTEAQALAALACSELLAAVAGGGSAEALALPVALARMATGADPIRPVINGWRMNRLGVHALDHVGKEVVSLPDTFSPAGMLAACRAAGWPLTAPMAAVADRHDREPNPDGVALAAAAMGR